MDPNPVIDISSDEDDVCGEPGGCVSGDWISSGLVLKRAVEDSDDVVVIAEIQPKRKRGRFCGAMMKSSPTDLDDDCVVLEGDPDKPIPVSNDSMSGPDDLLVVGEKGQIACRDYPHARSLCVMFPFSTTSHERHCNLCHCYVCDSPAPCLNWGKGLSSMDHCHATEKEAIWKHLRRDFKGLEKRLPKFGTHFTPQSNLIPEAETRILGQTGTVIGVDSTAINSATPRIRNQDVHNSQCLRKHIPVSALSRQNPVNGQGHRPNMDSESGTYQCASFTNVVNFLGNEGLHQPPAHGQPSWQTHSSESCYMHRNQIQPVVDSSFLEFSLSWQNEASTLVGQSSFNDLQVQSAVPTPEPSTAADYNHDFPSLPERTDCSAVMVLGNKSLSQPKQSAPSTGKDYDFGFPPVLRPANPSNMLGHDGQFPALDPMELHNWFMDDFSSCGDRAYTLSAEPNMPSLNSAAAVDPAIPLFGFESSLEWSS